MPRPTRSLSARDRSRARPPEQPPAPTPASTRYGNRVETGSVSLSCCSGSGFSPAIVSIEGWPADPDRVLDSPLARRTEQPALRELRQSVGMSGTHPRALTGLRRSAGPCSAGAWVPRPAHGLIAAAILNPPRGAESCAHRCGIAVPDVVDGIVWRADAQPRVLDDRIKAVWRWMAPDHRRVIGVFSAGKAGVDNLEQVGHGDRKPSGHGEPTRERPP